MKQSKPKLRVASKFNVDQLNEQPLFATNPEASLPLLSMIGQAQLAIEDLLGSVSRQFIEQLLVLSAQTVAGGACSAIEQRCGDAAKVQRCRIHKIRNVTERLPKDKAQQVRWVMAQAWQHNSRDHRLKPATEFGTTPDSPVVGQV